MTLLCSRLRRLSQPEPGNADKTVEMLHNLQRGYEYGIIFDVTNIDFVVSNQSLCNSCEIELGCTICFLIVNEYTYIAKLNASFTSAWLILWWELFYKAEQRTLYLKFDAEPEWRKVIQPQSARSRSRKHLMTTALRFSWDCFKRFVVSTLRTLENVNALPFLQQETPASKLERNRESDIPANICQDLLNTVVLR